MLLSIARTSMITSKAGLTVIRNIVHAMQVPVYTRISNSGFLCYTIKVWMWGFQVLDKKQKQKCPTCQILFQVEVIVFVVGLCILD